MIKSEAILKLICIFILIAMTINYQGIKFEGGEEQKRADALTVEAAIQINTNGQPFTVTMRTPGDDDALVRGLFHSEGIIKDMAFNPEIELIEAGDDGATNIVNVDIPHEYQGNGYSNSRTLLSVSSCGICGKTELDDIVCEGAKNESQDQFDISQLNGLFEQMRMAQPGFDKSGGSHAAGAFTTDGNSLAIKEDIGRHNAVDKVIGQLILDNQLPSAKLLTVSGRISYEIIIKTFKAKIPILCAVSAPSSLAVDYAKELGITLLAFCRDGRATCYANPHRLVGAK